MEIKPQFSLSQVTSFHIGGPADYFCSVQSVRELKEALKFALDKGLPILILGNGSNVLISDEGFRGLVVQNGIKGMELEESGRVKVAGGENWDDVVVAAVEKNFAGIECLSGIPGSAGGAVVQNIGAYGQTLGDLIVKINAIEIATGQEKTFSAAESSFVYRGSRFKKFPCEYIVTDFEFQLVPGGKSNISYSQVSNHFQNQSHPSVQEVREFIIRLRASKGYLIMPGYESFQTAGSFFKNPVVNQTTFEKLKPMLRGADLNRYWETSGGIKIAAAFLMQEAGFGKGYREGSVGISPKHSLSLANFGGGTAREIKGLAEKIKKTVLTKFGVQLEEEVLYIGNI